LSSRTTRSQVWILTAMALAFASFQGMAQTLVPLMMSGLDFSKTTIGLVQAIPGLMVIIGGPPLARMSTTRFRRGTLTAIFGINIAACLFYAFAQSPTTLIVPQLLLGLTSSGFYANMLATSFGLAKGPEQNVIQARITAGQGIGYFTGPLLGGYLSSLGFTWAFAAGAVIAAAGLIACTRMAPSRAIEPSLGFIRDWLGSYRRLYRVVTRRPIVILGAVFVFMNCFMLYVGGGSFFLVYASQMGLTAVLAAVLVSLRDVTGTLTRLSFGALSRWIPPVVLLGVGTIIGSLTMALLPTAKSPVALGIVSLVLGAATAFLPPAVNMLSGASAAPEEQAFAIVGLNFSNFLSQTIMAPIVGLALTHLGYGRSYPIIGITWAILGAIVLVVGLRVVKRNAPTPTAQPSALSHATGSR